MTAARRILPLLLGIGFAGCRDVSNPPVSAFGPRVALARSVDVAHAYFSGVTDGARLVIADSATWAATWAQVFAGVRPQPQLPPVDFGTDRVLLAALGERRAGGYDIRIDSTVQFAFGSIAYVASVAPGHTCGALAVITQPVDLVRLSPPVATPIAFDETVVIHECP